MFENTRENTYGLFIQNKRKNRKSKKPGVVLYIRILLIKIDYTLKLFYIIIKTISLK